MHNLDHIYMPEPAMARQPVQGQAVISCSQNVQHVRNIIADDDKAFDIQKLNVSYAQNPALVDVSCAFARHRITAMIGASGCGKSTLLRCLNRMNDYVTEVGLSGKVLFEGEDLYAARMDPVAVRLHIGMVFQRPNPFAKSIYKNVAWGPTVNGYQGSTDELVEHSLRQAALWDEVKDRLHESALKLSGGQQQRLCIARALAMQPQALLLDEPCSALDPISTAKIEDLLVELKSQYTIVIVTHNMQQAARVSDYTAFMESGRLVEFGETQQVFNYPAVQRTKEYVTGRFG